MNKALCSAVSLALLALSATAQADDYYIITPLDISASANSSESGSESSLIATLNETTLPVAYVNEAYSYDMKQLLVVTGDSELDLSQSTWEAVGALPDGMTLGTDGVFSGTPTSASPSEGTPFTVRATYKTASDEQTYYIQINFPVSVALASATLPTAQVGVAYSYDFKQLMDIISDPNENPSLAEFTAETALPEGLTLGTDGVLSGTPTQDSAGTSFTIRVHYKTAMAEHTYTQTVTLPIAVALAEATLPAAQVGQAYTYDMAPLVTISNDADPQPAQVSFEAASALPAGLSLSATGTLSGTPTTADAGASFSVLVTYKTAAAQRTYLLEVNVTISLASATLTPATAGTAYSYDLKQHLTVNGEASPDLSLSSWTAQTALPAGLTLGTNGIVSGTPSTVYKAGTNFNASTSYKTATSASKVFTIVVNGVELQVTKISAGVLHSCAVTTAGGVKCWGFNNFGQLGDGTTTNRTTPVAVSGLSSGVASVHAGAGHTCALMTAGGVKCWGRNGAGELGNGSFTNNYTPVDVIGLGFTVAAIEVGQYHNCAISVGGTPKCWGSAAVGKLGNGSTTNSSVPVNVTNVGTVISMSLGYNNTCAVTTAGAAKCWGANPNGELGNGTKVDSTTAVDVTGLGSGVASVHAGWMHTCAVLTSGTAKCWGYNYYGQLGDGTTTGRVSPVSVVGLTGISSLAVGKMQSCAVTTAGGAKCWGNNTTGQIGDGTTTTRMSPVNVTGLTSGVSNISSKNYHTCAMTSSGPKCWGQSTYGAVGDGTTSQRNSPVAVVGF